MRSRSDSLNYQTAVRLLASLRKTCAIVDSDSEVLQALDLIIKHLSTLRISQDGETLILASRSSPIREDTFSDAYLASLSVDMASEIASDTSSTRKLLERIAILRFSVPKGSMRSYATVDDLRAKILSSVDNIRAHDAIKRLSRQDLSDPQDV